MNTEITKDIDNILELNDNCNSDYSTLSLGVISVLYNTSVMSWIDCYEKINSNI